MRLSKSKATALRGGGRRKAVHQELIAIERCRDLALIKKLATDPAIFPHINDDYFADPEIWQPPRNEFIVYLVAQDPEGPFGFAIFHPRNLACYDAHFAFLPRSYGAKALSAFKQMLAWIWHSTTAARIVGEISVDNVRAIRFAEAAGCERYGVNVKSKLRGGILRDQVCLGISRP